MPSPKVLLLPGRGVASNVAIITPASLVVYSIWAFKIIREWVKIKVVNLETFLVNVPYKRTEVSSIVKRNGVTAVVVKLTSDSGLIGWGESCVGADVHSVHSAVQAMWPFVENRSPWDHEIIRADVFLRGLWSLRASTGNYAWAGIDMALWDLCGKEAKLPVFQLLGGAVHNQIDYFYYLSHGTLADIESQCQDGLKKGFSTFYLKTGINFDHELEMVRKIREIIGHKHKLRIDSNGAWTLQEAAKYLTLLEKYQIDFAEQPVREHPMSLMKELRSRTSVPIAANEGLWSEEDANRLIVNRVAEVYTFSPYWVGSLKKFQEVAYVAEMMGSQICRHTHGELGIAASAFHHVSLTIPNMVSGNQQTCAHMEGDILEQELPIATSSSWGHPKGPGLGFEIDKEALEVAISRFKIDGQYLPYGHI